MSSPSFFHVLGNSITRVNRKICINAQNNHYFHRPGSMAMLYHTQTLGMPHSSLVLLAWSLHKHGKINISGHRLHSNSTKPNTLKHRDRRLGLCTKAPDNANQRNVGYEQSKLHSKTRSFNRAHATNLAGGLDRNRPWELPQAHPGPTSSGLMLRQSSIRPPKRALSRSCRAGTRVLPPTRTTSVTSEIASDASFSTLVTVLIHLRSTPIEWDRMKRGVGRRTKAGGSDHRRAS